MLDPDTRRRHLYVVGQTSNRQIDVAAQPNRAGPRCRPGPRGAHQAEAITNAENRCCRMTAMGHLRKERIVSRRSAVGRWAEVWARDLGLPICAETRPRCGTPTRFPSSTRTGAHHDVRPQPPEPLEAAPRSPTICPLPSLHRTQPSGFPVSHSAVR